MILSPETNVCMSLKNHLDPRKLYRTRFGVVVSHPN